MPFAHFVWLVLCWGVMVLECLWLIQLTASWGVVLMLACDVAKRAVTPCRHCLDMPFAHFVASAFGAAGGVLGCSGMVAL